MEIINFLASRQNKRPDKELVFFQDGQELRVTHAQFDERADALALALAAAGLQPGDHVGIIARNSAEWALLDLACVKGRFVTAGFEYGRFPFSAALAEKYALKAVYVEPSAAGNPVSGCDVIDLGPIVRSFALAGRDYPVPASGAFPAPVRYRGDDVTTIKFTSGSTGEPKGLAATVGSIDSSIDAVQSIFAHGDGDNLLVFLPLSLLQQRYWIYSALAYGHQVTVTSYEFALEIARRAGPTVVMGVPGFFDSVRKMVEVTAPEAKHDPVRRRHEIEQYLGTAIRYLWTGSAPANPSTLAFFTDAGLAIYEGYGMNETCIVAKNHPGAHKPGSVGKLLPNKRARIDEGGVLVIGSDFPVNTHYAYCGEGDNERIFLPDGEVRTGDLARIDEDGFLYILGRADDVIALGNGKNVYVRSLEEKVKSHESVLDCVLYGAGKPYLVAVLSVAPGDAGLTAVHAHIKQVNAGLPPAERIVKTFVAPRAFTVEDGLLTSQFKPKRKNIYQTYASEIEQLFGT